MMIVMKVEIQSQSRRLNKVFIAAGLFVKEGFLSRFALSDGGMSVVRRGWTRSVREGMAVCDIQAASQE